MRNLRYGLLRFAFVQRNKKNTSSFDKDQINDKCDRMLNYIVL